MTLLKTSKATANLCTLFLFSVLISVSSTYTTTLQIDDFSSESGTILDISPLPDFTCLEPSKQSQCYQTITEYAEQSPNILGNFRLAYLFLDVESDGYSTPSKVSTDAEAKSFISSNTFSSTSTITNTGSKNLTLSFATSVAYFDYLTCQSPNSPYNPTNEYYPPNCDSHYGTGDIVDLTVNGGNAFAFSFASSTPNERISVYLYAVTRLSSGDISNGYLLLDSFFIDEITGEYVVPFSDLGDDDGASDFEQVTYLEIGASSDVVCCVDEVQNLAPSETLTFEFQISNVRVVSIEEDLSSLSSVSSQSSASSRSSQSSGSSRSSGGSSGGSSDNSSQSSDASLSHLQILLCTFCLIAVLF